MMYMICTAYDQETVHHMSTSLMGKGMLFIGFLMVVFVDVK